MSTRKKTYVWYTSRLHSKLWFCHTEQQMLNNTKTPTWEKRMKTNKCNSNIYHIASENTTGNVDLDLNPNFKIRKKKNALSMKYKPKYIH